MIKLEIDGITRPTCQYRVYLGGRHIKTYEFANDTTALTYLHENYSSAYSIYKLIDKPYDRVGAPSVLAKYALRLVYILAVIVFTILFVYLLFALFLGR